MCWQHELGQPTKSVSTWSMTLAGCAHLPLGQVFNTVEHGLCAHTCHRPQCGLLQHWATVAPWHALGACGYNGCKVAILRHG